MCVFKKLMSKYTNGSRVVARAGTGDQSRDEPPFQLYHNCEGLYGCLPGIFDNISDLVSRSHTLALDRFEEGGDCLASTRKLVEAKAEFLTWRVAYVNTHNNCILAFT